MKKPQVYKANALANAAYVLSLSEQSLVLSAITHVRRDQPVTDEIRYAIKAIDLAPLPGFSGNNHYRNLKATAERLQRRLLAVRSEPNSGAKRVLKFGWVQEAEYCEEEGTVEIRFTKAILPYLNELSTKFFSYDLDFIKGMKSIYGIRLYELMKQFPKGGILNYEISTLKEMWGISDKYKLIKDFKKDVIDRAVVDVNACTEIEVQKVAYRKTGRTVKYISIAFQPKNAQAPASKRMTNEEIDKSGLARPGESHDNVRKRLTPAVARKQMAAKSAPEATEATEAYEPL